MSLTKWQLKDNNVNSIQNDTSWPRIFLCPYLRREMYMFLCNYSFITSPFWRQKTMVCCIHTTPFPKCHVCMSERQSNMTAIYAHWIGWKLLARSLRPCSPKRIGEEADKGGKSPVKFWILGCQGAFATAGTPMCPQTQQLYGRVRACSELQQKRCFSHTHTHTHACTHTPFP